MPAHTCTPRRLRTAERELARRDPVMAQLIARHGRCALAPRLARSPYEALVTAVLYQQLAGKAAETILRRLLALFPDQPFPSPDALIAVEADALRSAGVSRQKQSYLRDIAIKARDGVIPAAPGALDRLSDDAIVARLTQARGVGRWTVEMFLIFTLGRLDVLPRDDYGIRAGYAAAYGTPMPAPGQLHAAGTAWAPYRSVAAWYLWRTADERAG